MTARAGEFSGTFRMFCLQDAFREKCMMPRTGKTSVWILGDQLTPLVSSLEGLSPGNCVVLMIESIEHCKRLPFHKQKLVLVWSAMRHFAEELRALGYEVDYYQTQESFAKALPKHVKKHRPNSLRLMESAEYGLSDSLATAAKKAGTSAEITPNSMFLSDKQAFQKEAKGKRSRVMESFYRKMRRETGILMNRGRPAGGKWNYDAENRKPAPPDTEFPSVPKYAPDAVTRRVQTVVEKKFPGHFGRADSFAWPVTRRDAEHFLDDFLQHRLAQFGPFQDAMLLGQRTLFHSLLSPLLNLGLLEPLDVCKRAEERYLKKEAPLNSVEGFVRQILGWREYMYQVFHWRMPGFARRNSLRANLPLPYFYWTGETQMRCIRETVEALIEDGISHHIQRLMLTGNFALIAGIKPQEVNEWYWLAFVDAYEWVVTPNVIGMSLFADGGVLGTKPYAASANYINRMSDYCRQCAYNPRKTTEDTACPFNALYWDFLARNEKRLKDNRRMALVYKNLKKKTSQDLKAIRARAQKIRRNIRNGKPL